MSYFSGAQEIDPYLLQPFFYSGSGTGIYSKMATELIWLLSHNSGTDLREVNSTGSWENSYRILTGQATMTIVQDDLFTNLLSQGEMYDSVQAANMKKIAPLHYEYLHVVINTELGVSPNNWAQWGSVPTTLQQIFTDPAPLNNQEPKLYINVGPKTSGSFITAMKVIQSYRNIDSDSDGTPDLDEMQVHYSFDSESDSVAKVNAGTDGGGYHITFIVSGLPYHRFYSHDTYNLTSSCGNCRLISGVFYSGSAVPEPYQSGTLQGNGTSVYEDYPYSSTILPSATLATVRVRAILAAASPFDLPSTGIFLKSVFRKSYYKTHPADPDDLDFQPDPPWIAINKESYTAKGAGFDTDADYETYKESVTGAKEYFVNNPFGWDDQAADYYLSLFP